MIPKKLVPRALVLGELVLFGAWYFFSQHGLHAQMSMRAENASLQADIQKWEQDLCALESMMEAWEQYPFYKEKYAREQLHMGRKGETVYVID